MIAPDAPAAPVFAPSPYPRRYPIRRTWRAWRGAQGVFFTGTGTMVVLKAVPPLLAALAEHHTTLLDPAGFLMTIGTALLAIGIACIAAAIRAELLLEADAISRTSAFGTSRIRTADIAGRRLAHGSRGAPDTILLISARTGHVGLRLRQIFDSDPVLEAWLAALPDQDAADRARQEAQRQESLQQILADPVHGASPGDRQARLRAVSVFGALLSAYPALLCLWCIIHPRPYGPVVTMVAALPWLAVLLVAWPNSLFRFHSRQASVRPSLLPLLLLPGIALAIRGVADVTQVSGSLDPGPMALIGFGLFLAALAADQQLRRHRRIWWLVLPLVLLYGAGAALVGNALLDRAPPVIFTPRITAHYIKVWGKGPPDHVLQFAPWGPYREWQEQKVPADLYHAAEGGVAVCIQLHPGAFAIAWYRTELCPDGNPAR